MNSPKNIAKLKQQIKDLHDSVDRLKAEINEGMVKTATTSNEETVPENKMLVQEDKGSGILLNQPFLASWCLTTADSDKVQTNKSNPPKRSKHDQFIRMQKLSEVKNKVIKKDREENVQPAKRNEIETDAFLRKIGFQYESSLKNDVTLNSSQHSFQSLSAPETVCSLSKRDINSFSNGLRRDIKNYVRALVKKQSLSSNAVPYLSLLTYNLSSSSSNKSFQELDISLITSSTSVEFADAIAIAVSQINFLNDSTSSNLTSIEKTDEPLTLSKIEETQIDDKMESPVVFNQDLETDSLESTGEPDNLLDQVTPIEPLITELKTSEQILTKLKEDTLSITLDSENIVIPNGEPPSTLTDNKSNQNSDTDEITDLINQNKSLMIKLQTYNANKVSIHFLLYNVFHIILTLMIILFNTLIIIMIIDVYLDDYKAQLKRELKYWRHEVKREKGRDPTDEERLQVADSVLLYNTVIINIYM